VNVALIGHGYWGKILEKYLKESSVFNLKYVCNSKSNLNEVWEDLSVGAVIVATRNEQRYEIVCQALLHNKHVLTEKPLAMTYKDACMLCDISHEVKRELIVDYNFMVSPSLLITKNMVANNIIGELVGFDMRINHLAPFGGGSVYWILGSHCLSVISMFMDLNDLTYEKRDIVNINGEAETGTIITSKGQIHLSLNYPERAVEFVFYGKKGTIVYNPKKKPTLLLDKYKKPNWMREVPQQKDVWIFDEANNARFMLDYFRDVMQGKSESNLKVAKEITGILEYIQDDR
jgi:predicted dehydrogenase